MTDCHFPVQIIREGITDSQISDLKARIKKMLLNEMKKNNFICKIIIAIGKKLIIK